MNRNIHFSKRWLPALAAVPVILLALAVGVLTLDSSGTPTVSGDQSPADCNANNLVLGFARVPANTQQGATIEYRILARNNTSADPFACDITGADVSFTEPALNGTATGTTHTLATNVSLPADGTGDLCFRSSTAPASLACPVGTTEVIDDDLSYVTNVTPGTTSVVAAARITGNRPPTVDCPNGAATLHDSDTESDACAAQTLTNGVVNAKISLSPPTDTNEVGTTHNITCTIQIHMGGPTTFVNAPNGTVCDADIDSGPGGFVGDDDDCVVDGGDGNCIIAITSNVTGRTVVSACTEEQAPPGGLTVNGQVLSRCTDGVEVAPGHSNGLPVEKFWVSARIFLAPPQDSNEVGSNHLFTCHIQIDIGDGNGFVDAPAGTNCDLDIVSGVGDFDPAGDDSCLTIGATGACQVDIVSNVAGNTVVKACTEEDQVTPGLTVTATNNVGVQLTRCTTSLQAPPTLQSCTPIAAEGPTDAVKCWVTARILLAPPQDSNEIGNAHVFTCHIQIDQGDGLGFVDAPAGTTCDLDIVSGVGDFNPALDDSCLTVGTTGACTVDIISNVTGVTVVKACTEEDQGTPGLTVLGVALSRCTTNLVGPPTLQNCTPIATEGPTDAVKCWVNARIFLAPPQDSNAVGSNHLFTCHIQIDQGDGLGFVDAPAGTNCDLDIISGVGDFSPAGDDSCLTVGATGACQVDIVSNVTGITVVRACTEEDQATPGLTVLGVALTRCTTALQAPPTVANCTPILAEGPTDAVKCWVNARISITPDGTNRVGSPHTFTCTVEVDQGSGTFGPATDGTLCEVSIVSGPGSITGSPCPTVGGSCQVTGNSAITGLTQVRACADVLVLGVTINDICTAPIAPAPTASDCDPTPTPTPAGSDALKCWINARIRITPNATNPVNSPHTFVCTIQVEVAPATFVNPPAGTQCAVTIVNGGPGTITGSPCNIVGDSCSVTDNSPNPGLDQARACTTFTYLGVTFTNLCTETPGNAPTVDDCPIPTSENPFGVDAFKCWFEQPGECFVLWDEEALDNDFRTVERAARKLGVTPDFLINDNKPKEKTNSGDWNEWVLEWVKLREATSFTPGTQAFNDRFVVRIQTGQDMDEGWYVLPEDIRHYDGPDVSDDQAWIEGLVNGTLDQDELDKILDVQPLRNHDLATLKGKTCTALVWDSDISMNYKPRNANLQGAKLGLITFKILDVVMPQATAPDGTLRIPESTSDTSFFDVIIQIEPRQFVAEGYPVNQVQQTDTVAITRARCTNGTLTVRAETSNDDAQLYISIEGPGTPPQPPLLEEELRTAMMTNLGNGRFEHVINGVDCVGLRNKVVTVWSDNDGDPLAPVPPGAYGSGGTYNKRISN